MLQTRVWIPKIQALCIVDAWIVPAIEDSILNRMVVSPIERHVLRVLEAKLLRDGSPLLVAQLIDCC